MCPRRRRATRWDSAIFIAWLVDEQRDIDEVEGIRKSVERIESGEDLLVAGDILWQDMIVQSLEPRQAKLFEGLFKRRKAQRLPYDPAIPKLTEQIRAYYMDLKRKDPSEKIPGTVDSTHLAYAIHYQVSTTTRGRATRRGR